MIVVGRAGAAQFRQPATHHESKCFDMNSDNTRPSLLSRVRNPHDAEAWREFEARYGDLITRYCRSVHLQHSDAEDVRQLVMLGLSSAMRSFQYDPMKGRFRTYVGRAVRNAVLRVRQCPPGRGIPLQLNDETIMSVVSSGDFSAADEVWDRHWCEHHLRRAFAELRPSLNPRSIEAFDSLLAGRSVAEVAEQLDMKTEAVKKVKQRVRAKLREIVAVQISEEEERHGNQAPSETR